jgi:hypothetical protein
VACRYISASETCGVEPQTCWGWDGHAKSLTRGSRVNDDVTRQVVPLLWFAKNLGHPATEDFFLFLTHNKLEMSNVLSASST